MSTIKNYITRNAARMDDGKIKVHTAKNYIAVLKDGVLVEANPKTSIVQRNEKLNCDMRLYDLAKASTGIRMDLEPDKFVAHRPDFDQSGRVQLEFGLGKVSRNGASHAFPRISTPNEYASGFLGIGDIYHIQSHYGMGLYYPMDQGTKSFEILEPLGITGLSHDRKGENIIGFWDSETSEYVVGINRPRFCTLSISPMGAEMITLNEDINGNPLPKINFDVINIDGSYYLKKWADLSKVTMPENFYIAGAETLYSILTDGYLQYTDSSWSTIQNATDAEGLDYTGVDIIVQVRKYNTLYYIYRGYLGFQIPIPSGTYAQADIEINARYILGNTNCGLYKANKADTSLSVSDWDNWETDSWMDSMHTFANGSNQIQLNSTAITDINNAAGGNLWTVIRHEKDVNNNPPTNLDRFYIYSANDATNDPILNLYTEEDMAVKRNRIMMVI